MPRGSTFDEVVIIVMACIIFFIFSVKGEGNESHSLCKNNLISINLLNTDVRYSHAFKNNWINVWQRK